MKRWLGGTRVPAGFYWRPASWEIVTLLLAQHDLAVQFAAQIAGRRCL